MKSKKNIIIIVVAMAVIFVPIALMGIFRDFDAQQYVRVLLEQTFYGEIDEDSSIIEGVTEEELYAQYEAGVESFVPTVIPKGAELTEEQEKQYIAVCKKIFKEMKFKIHSEEKISDTEFEVKVKYQPSDAIVKYMNSVSEELARMEEKVENGEYQGTKEEILLQMQNEFLENACGLLEEACDSMEYGKEQTMVFTVVEGENELYQVSDKQMKQFLEKILRLDEIQD